MTTSGIPPLSLVNDDVSGDYHEAYGFKIYQKLQIYWSSFNLPPNNFKENNLSSKTHYMVNRSLKNLYLFSICKTQIQKRHVLEKNMVNLPNLTRKGAFRPKWCGFVNHLMVTIGIPFLSLVNGDDSI
ncbi:hypothetical protein Hanom_Chr12g01154421 [Helianthus anomalus]